MFSFLFFSFFKALKLSHNINFELFLYVSKSQLFFPISIIIVLLY